MPPPTNCPMHVSVLLEFVAAAPNVRRPRKRGKALNEAYEDEATANRAGILRCPVPGCYRCAPAEVVQPRLKFCPTCEELTDAPKYRQAIYDYRCARCWRSAQAKAKRHREKEKQEAN